VNGTTKEMQTQLWLLNGHMNAEQDGTSGSSCNVIGEHEVRILVGLPSYLIQAFRVFPQDFQDSSPLGFP
jgi:hypothetical protein